MTPQEWKDKTIKDLATKRKRSLEGKKQAQMHSFENMNKIQRRCYGR